MLLAILSLLLQAAPPSSPPTPSDAIVARVPKTFLHVRLEMPGFTPDERRSALLMNQYGDKGVLFGAILARGASLFLLAEPEGEVHVASAERRKRAFDGSEMHPLFFEVGDIACAETTLMADRSLGTHDFYAFPVTGGFRFDFHLSAAIQSGKEHTLTREVFAQIVSSFRVAIVRRGKWDDLPREVLDLMNETAFRMPVWNEWMEEQAKRRADDWVVPFVKAEALRHRGAPERAQADAYARAIALLDARKELARPERFVRVLAEDGLGLALADMGEVEQSIHHFRRGYDLACELDIPARAGLLYNLSCSYARLEDAGRALELLRKAIEIDPSYLKRAAQDRDYEKIRANKEFQDLVRGDRGAK